MMWPGGATGMSSKGGPSTWAKTGQFLISNLIQANDAGDFFPMYGTCLGYELMTLVFSNNYSIRVPIKTGEDVRKDIYITSAGESSKMFADLEDELIEDLPTAKLAFFHHTWTPDPEEWTKNPYLAGNFTVTSLTNDTAGKMYPSNVEGKIYPCWGGQYHPEKNTYEWYTKEGIDHE